MVTAATFIEKPGSEERSFLSWLILDTTASTYSIGALDTDFSRDTWVMVFEFSDQIEEELFCFSLSLESKAMREMLSI